MQKLLFQILLSLGVVICGCTGQTGPSGPSGSSGSPAPYTFQTTFQNGVFPTSSYSGEIDTWVDASQQSTVLSGDAFRRIKTGSTSTNYGRVLLKFDVTSIPVNATIVSAEVQLKTITTTNIGSSSVTVGAHDLPTTLYTGGCIWGLTATWLQYGSSSGWNTCDGDTSGNQLGYFNNVPLSTVVLTNSLNSSSSLFEWSIPSSTVKTWINGKNNGLVFRSEGEFNEGVSSIDFYPYNDPTASNHAVLIVTYQ